MGLIELIAEVSGGNVIALAAILSSLAMLSTTLGGLPVILLRGKGATDRGFSLLVDLGLGFSSGVMLVASFTSLLLPAMERFGPLHPLLGLVTGALAVHAVNLLIPHEHLVKGYEGPEKAVRKLKAAWLVALAIIIHNLPEGLSIGVASAFGVGDAVALGLAISLQDAPEGLAVSLPVYATTGSMSRALLYAWLSGFSEVVLAVVAAALTSVSLPMLPAAMGFGAGAMIYVVSHEALPETHRSGHENKATLSFFVGFIVMLLLDTMLR